MAEGHVVTALIAMRAELAGLIASTNGMGAALLSHGFPAVTQPI